MANSVGIAVFGTAAVGKSSLMRAMSDLGKPSDNQAAAGEPLAAVGRATSFVEYESKQVRVDLLLPVDPLREIHGRAFRTVLPGTDFSLISAVYICFNVANAKSLEVARRELVPAARNKRAGLPIILVGLQADRRDNSGANELISQDAIETTANESGVAFFRECSALTRAGVLDLLDATLREVDAAKTRVDLHKTQPAAKPEGRRMRERTGPSRRYVDDDEEPRKRLVNKRAAVPTKPVAPSQPAPVIDNTH